VIDTCPFNTGRLPQDCTLPRGHTGKCVSTDKARIAQLEAALEAAAGLRESDLDGADLYVHRWRQLLAGVTAETPVSTLCAVCDQIKELHPATHAWTAKETWSRFPRAMLDPDFKAETATEPVMPKYYATCCKCKKVIAVDAPPQGIFYCGYGCT
jgi:hypothetical protein